MLMHLLMINDVQQQSRLNKNQDQTQGLFGKNRRKPATEEPEENRSCERREIRDRIAEDKDSLLMREAEKSCRSAKVNRVLPT